MSMHERQRRIALLRDLMAELMTSEPDGYGLILQAVAEAGKDPVISERAMLCYREDIMDALNEAEPPNDLRH